ncbi:hypothetical protein PS834_01353 [Pseudomonas fluorescens]|nr:hypothetical protein PS834_01353 [Pseudomonas fluorescens]
MSIFKYSAYYDHKLTRENFLREEISEEEIEKRICEFSKLISNHFEERNERASIGIDGIVNIETKLAEKDCNNVVALIAVGLDLLPKKH